MFCPNCKGELIKNPKHAQGVFECQECLGVFFILVTTPPSVEVSKNKRLNEPARDINSWAARTIKQAVKIIDDMERVVNRGTLGE